MASVLDWDFAGIQAALAAASVKKSVERALSKGPRLLGTYDTETDPFHNCDQDGLDGRALCIKCFGQGRIPYPFLHGIYLGESDDYVEFTTVQEVVDYVSSRKLLLYAHNGGKFDLHPLRDHMNTDEPLKIIN